MFTYTESISVIQLLCGIPAANSVVSGMDHQELFRAIEPHSVRLK